MPRPAIKKRRGQLRSRPRDHFTTWRLNEEEDGAMHDELLSLQPQSDFTRRQFVVTSLAAGFAMAVQPVSAETITTDAKGLEAGEVKIPAKGGEMPGYRAMPATGGPFPVILVVQEIFGVHEHI